tara:strand:- start:5071 stop:5307 length:237 start_codon:yes stop_codon:yes gene_type:complete
MTIGVDISNNNNNLFTSFDSLKKNNIFLETNSIFSNEVIYDKIGKKNIDIEINLDQTLYKSINLEPPRITRQNAFNIQ